MSRPVYFLVPLLVFFLLLDIEANFLTIHSADGERVAQAGVDDAARSAVSAGIKTSDLFFAMLWLLFVANVFAKRLPLKVFFNRTYVLFLLFAGTGIALLYYGGGGLLGSQAMIAMLYNIKFLEISLIFPFILMYGRFGYDDRRIVHLLMWATLIGGMIGSINIVFPIFSGVIIFDRPGFYGPLALSTLFLLHISLTPALNRKFRLSPATLLAAIVIASAAVILCDKRAIVLGFAAGLFFLVLPLVWRKPVLWVVFAPVLVVGVGMAVHETVFSISGSITEGISPQYASAIESTPNLVWSFIKELRGLDYSTRERIGKMVFGVLLIADRPWFGFGLNSAPYLFSKGFLPDNLYIALLVETGIVGVVLVFLFFAMLWRSLAPLKKQRMFGGIRAIFAAFFMMGVGVNTVMTFSLFAIFLALCALSLGWVETLAPAPARISGAGRAARATAG